MSLELRCSKDSSLTGLVCAFTCSEVVAADCRWFHEIALEVFRRPGSSVYHILQGILLPLVMAGYIPQFPRRDDLVHPVAPACREEVSILYRCLNSQPLARRR